MRTASLAILDCTIVRHGTHQIARMLCRSTQYDITISYSTYPVDSGATRGDVAYARSRVSVVQEFTTTFDRSQFAEAGATSSVRLCRVYRAIPEAARRRYRDGGHLCAFELVRPAGQASHLRLPRHARFPVPDDGGHARWSVRSATTLPPISGTSATSRARSATPREAVVLLELEMTQAMRAKLAEKLTWLEKKTKDPVSISRCPENAALRSEGLALHPDACRRRRSRMLRHRRLACQASP